MAPVLRLLGGARIEVDQVPVRGRAAHRRRLALLALLTATPGNRLSREQIVTLLWPSHGSEGGRRQLSESLHVIRRAFGEQTILSVGDEVSLVPELMPSDLAAFRAAIAAGELEEAVAAYSGPFLHGWFIADAREFEDWVEAERIAVARVHASALETLAARCEAAGDWLAAAVWWHTRSRSEPDASGPVLRLSQALAADGQRAAALRTIAAHLQLLQDEGLPADRALLTLHANLRGESAEDAHPRTSRRDLTDAADRSLTTAIEPLGTRPASQVVSQVAGGTTASTEGSSADQPLPRPRTAFPASVEYQGLSATHSWPEAGTRAPHLETKRAERDHPDMVEAGASEDQSGERPHRWLAQALGLLVVLLMGAVAISTRTTGAGDSVRSPRDPNRIAVLYFDDHSREDIRYLADGLTERLIEELNSVPVLKVVPRSWAKHYRDLRPAPPLDTIAAHLGTGTIVEGSVQRAGNQIRVTVSLLDVRSQTELVNTRVIERPMDEQYIFALQDELARQVAAFLRRQLGEEIRMRVSRSGTTSGLAQHLLLKGDYARRSATAITQEGDATDVLASRNELARADSLLAEAEVADPIWLAPIVARGWVAHDLAQLDEGTNAANLLHEAAKIADRALSRDPNHAPALELRGTARWKLARLSLPASRDSLHQAESDLRRALAEDSTRAGAAITLSQLLRTTARTSEQRLEAVAFARQAYELDAYLAYEANVISQIYRATLAMHQPDSASAWCARGRHIAPRDWRFIECELALMRVDFGATAPQRAWRLVTTLERMDPPSRAVSGHPYSPYYRRLVAATVSARNGQRDSARRVLNRALRDVSSDAELRIDIKHEETFLLLALGDHDGAMSALRAYLSARPQYYGAVLNDLAFRQFDLDSAIIAQRIRLRGTGGL